jgi:hypothetical protein
MNAKPVVDPKILRQLPRLLRAIQRSVVRLGPRPPAGTDLRVYQARPWWHDFSSLGLTTNFAGYPSAGERLVNMVRGLLGKGPMTSEGSHQNQMVRDPDILPALDKAFALHRERYGEPGSFLDTFSNDGFYGFWVADKYRTPRITCVELMGEYVARGRLMAEVLRKPEVQFVCQDVHDMDASPVDIALCMGGLYHVTDPDAVVAKIRTKAKFLVAHACTSMKSDDPAYFVTPAPTLHHGCRFSHAYFLAMLSRAGWNVVECGHAIYPAPSDENSTGSSWALCE